MIPWIRIYVLYMGIGSVVCVLHPPDGLKAVVTSPNTFHVIWQRHLKDNERNATFYKLRYRPSDSKYKYMDTVLTETVISNAMPNTSYEFSLKFHKGRRSSSWSLPVYNRTTEESKIIISKPRFLRIRHLSAGMLKIKWRKPKRGADDIIGYRLIFGERGNTTKVTVNLTSRSYLVSNLKPGTTYDVIVMAIGERQLSNASSINFIAPHKLILSPPRNLTVKSAGAQKFKVTWKSPLMKNTKITNYKIQYKRKNVRRGDLCSVTTHSRKKEYIISDLRKDETYKVRIAAKSIEGTGKFTKWVTAQTPPRKESKSKRHDSYETTIGNDVSTTIKTTTEIAVEAPPINLSMHIQPIKGGLNVTWSSLGINGTSIQITVLDGSEEVEADINVLDNSAVIDGLEGKVEYNVVVDVYSSSGGLLVSSEGTGVPKEPLQIEGLGDVQVYSGSNATLSCAVTSAFDAEVGWMIGDTFEPFPNGVWFVQRKNLNFQVESVETGINRLLTTLTITRVSKEDAGTYYCRAMDREYMVEGYVNMYVKDPIPGPVTNLQAEPMSPRKIHLVWSSPTSGPDSHGRGNVTYKIRYIKDGQQDIYASISGIRENHYMLNDLEPSTTYHVVVVAENEFGTSSNSGNDEITITTPPMLEAPTIVLVKTLNSSLILIEWENPNTTDVLEYIVKYRTSTNTTWNSISVSKTETDAFLKDLEERQNYEIRVEALTSEGIVTSSWTEASTYPDAYLDESRKPPPPADVYLDVINITLHISWLPPPYEYKTLVRWYEAEVFVDGVFLTRSIVEEESKEITVDNIDPSYSHFVYVRALNKNGQSDPVRRIYNPIFEDTDNIVTNLRAEALNSTAVLVTWSPPKRPHLTRYLIRHQPLGLPSAKLTDKWLPLSFDSYVLVDLLPFIEYKISVIPYIDDIERNISSVRVRTLSDVPNVPPANFTASVINDTFVLLSWSSPYNEYQSGALTGYNIQYQTSDRLAEPMDIFVNASVNYYIITGLQVSVIYVFRIAAMTVNGTGPYTDGIPVTIRRR